MKIRLLVLPVFLALLASGCGKRDAAPAGAGGTTGAAPPTSAAPAVPAVAPKAEPRLIEITGNDQMKFSVTRIEANAGDELRVKFTNVGMLPKEAMGHNWVLLKPGTDVNAFAAAAMMARDKEYIPDQLKDQIVAYTRLLGPKQSDEVTFTVPAAGEYPFVCSFPAHTAAGMRGVLVAR